MPKGIYDGFSCVGKKKETFVPQSHQKETMKYFLKSPHKGLLLFHELGSGKTCTSIMIGDKMLERGMVEKVYILTPGSLRQGWISEYCMKCGMDPIYLKKNYIFVTYNYTIGKNLPDFNNSLVIIDEVHNLINGVKNMSFHSTAIYNALMSANCRIVALSGTIVYNYVYEFALLGNLLKPGGEFPEIRKEKDLNIEAFMKFFNIDEEGYLRPKNNTRFKKRLEGIISYFPGAGKEYVPEVLEQKPIKLLMTPEQEINYWIKEDQERKLAKKPAASLMGKNKKVYDVLMKMYIMAQKNILTRLASNFYYSTASVDIEEKTEADIKSALPEDDKELNEDDADIAVGRPLKRDIPISEGGWIEKSKFSDGALFKTYSTKFTALLTNIVLHNNQKHVVFTFFKERAGVYLIKSILGMCGIKSAIFSGDLNDDDRRRLLARYNDPKNRYGDVIRVLLVTEAGAEGISVLEARHMHILESSNRVNKTTQAIGRVARFKSHIELPLTERNVKIWRYWSIATDEPLTFTAKSMGHDGQIVDVTKTVTDKRCIDELLYDRGMKIKRETESFKKLLKSVSVTSYKDE
jgi:superfamily II DNA or RNA helicase